MTPAPSDHGRILAECYQILRQAAARAAAEQSTTPAGKAGAGAATEVRGVDARSSTP